eukprot:gene521-997_t
MFTSSSCVFSVNYQARSICAQRACKDRHRFIVGTCSVREKNELTVLEYDEDTNQMDAAAIYHHPHQIWVTEPSPQDLGLVITSSQSLNGSKAVTLYRMPKQTEQDFDIEQSVRGGNFDNREPLELEKVSAFQFKDSSTFVHTVKWHGLRDYVLTVDPKTLSTWSIGEGSLQLISKLNITSSSSSSHSNSNANVGDWTSGGAAWDPHNQQTCALVTGPDLRLVDTRRPDLRLVDTRSMEVTQSVADAHIGGARDVDFNPNKPLNMITCGDDRTVKFWDVRNLTTPVKTLSGHSHWVWTAKFNPFHDQLIVSGGTDNLVNLWRVASVSSAPWLGADEGEGNDSNSDPPDIRAIDQHEESVYGIAWSSAVAWMYCSLSYDGRVILNHVPSTEKNIAKSP